MTSPVQEAVLAALWDNVLEKWDAPEVHEAFLNACSVENNLAFAATRYRQQKDGSDEEKHEVSEAQLARITGLAMAQMVSQKSTPKDHKKLVTVIAIVVATFMIGACLYMISL